MVPFLGGFQDYYRPALERLTASEVVDTLFGCVEIDIECKKILIFFHIRAVILFPNSLSKQNMTVLIKIHIKTTKIRDKSLQFSRFRL